MNKNITLASNKDCTGCASCYNICPKQAITMSPNTDGFLMPVIDDNKCIECHSCEKHCPVLNTLKQQNKETKLDAYAVIFNEDRAKSSSGGAFSMFARYVLRKGGVVYGAAMDETLHLHYERVTDENGLNSLRGSKYVQCAIGDSFKHVRDDLRKGTMVLFCGTPCEVAGLYKFLGKHYEELLITLDLVCHGVPSQAVFDSYIKKLSKECFPGRNITGFRFRKLDSWSIIPAVQLSESKWVILEQEANVYMESFFKGITYRESCFHCAYANLERVGTFTLADFWGIGKHGKKFQKNVSSGVSLVLDNQKLMPSMIDDLSKMAYIEKRSVEEALFENSNLNAPVKRKPERDTAISDLLNPAMSLKEYGQKYKLLPKKNLKYLLTKTVKNVIYFFGLYNVYKTISYKIR